MLDDYAPLIDKWLEEDRKNWHKQRHTARRVFERLAAEHSFEGSYSTVQRYVKRCKEEHRGSGSQYLDQDWPPGQMQVDFGQADFRIVGVRTRMHNLVCAFPFSNVGLAQVFYGETAECVCEGLSAVFEHIGGVPRKIVFDNATGVGRKVCGVISTSKLFSAFAAHYGFSYAFCSPRAGHEKGSVENKVGAMRRSLFVPVPQFDNVRRYNERLLDMSIGHSDKAHYRKGESQLALFEEDCFALSPLPDSRFSAVSYTEHKADKYGNVVLDGRHRYSTDPAYANCRLIVGAGAFDVDIYDREGAHIVTHERGWGDKPTESIEPVSQLALLCRKPGGWHESRVRSALPDDVRRWIELVTIDEVNPSIEEMVTLVAAFQHFLDEGKKVALIMAGLPYGVTSLLSGKSTSFLRRAARYELQALSDYEVEEALVRTMKDGGKTFEPDALEAAVKAIKGFPFMLQLVGYRVWWMAESSSVIDISSVDAAANIARKELEQRIYDAVWFELSEADKSFLQAMTEDSEITRQADLPSRLNKPSGHVSKYKKRMLQQGVIRERSRGLLEFCLPGFKEYFDERIAEERGAA